MVARAFAFPRAMTAIQICSPRGKILDANAQGQRIAACLDPAYLMNA
jgi:hypothetical protein